MLSFSALLTEVGYTMFFIYKELQNMSSVEFFFITGMIVEICCIFQDHVSKLWLSFLGLSEFVNMCGKELHLDLFFFF